MILVDGHCHASPVWYEPVETLLYEMDRNDVEQAVLVQILGQYDNGYQQECLQRYPGRFVSVVAVDAARQNACGQLAELAAQGASGVRLRPGTRSPGGDPLAIWRAAQSQRLAVSCVGTSDAFASREFFELAAALPELTIVLEHLGGTSRPDADIGQAATRRRVLDLAELPNVYLKVPGLGELSARTKSLPTDGLPLDRNPAILREALERFGSDRLLWGSDFPPVAAREGYGNALRWAREAFADLPSRDLAKIFGETARRVFELPSVQRTGT